ncbi:hypothetical protein [Sutcliffiella halmapala]|uniref:hypothetical protein n=1 Tax=Sutcliffiella halmapala TaxID=79882 RepID=UPI000994DC40|nr:hypothetical protein [Sutcliffiella halmapala]
MKRILSLIAIASLVVFLSVIVNHYKNYSISNSERDILSFLQNWYEENEGVQEAPFILELITVDNSDMLIATFLHKEEQIGIMLLKKGLNQKLKLVKILDEQSFYSELLETNKGKYVLFAGENQKLAIKTIYTDIVDESGPKSIDIPPQRYFTQIKKAENLLKSSASPIFHYRTLRDALDAEAADYRDMEIMFVDEDNQTFMLHSLIDSNLNTVLGSFELSEEGYTLHTIEDSDTYSMVGDKAFCFEEKKIKNADKEITFLHGLIPDKDKVKRVVLVIEIEDEMIYQTASEVKNQQFLLHVQIPERLIDGEKTKKKFLLYDEKGKYLGTEMKL